MLKIIASSGPQDSLRLLEENFENIQTQKMTWLISDLKSKLEIQNSLLQKYDFLNSESVLRASELWRLLLFRVNPEWQVVSREFAISLIGQFLKEVKTDEVSGSNQLRIESKFFQAENQGIANSIYNYITQLMPVLSHPMGAEMMGEWLEQNRDSNTRWGHWFLLSSQVWKIFLKRKCVAAPWTSGVLVNELDIDKLWSRALTVDLGSELSQVESEVLVMLSKYIDVVVIEPSPAWAQVYAETLTPYKRLHEARSLQINSQASLFGRSSVAAGLRFYEEASGEDRVSFKKFSTELAEVKDVCAQIRKHLDAGIKAQEIAIIAPDVDSYLPALSSYLKVEGVRINRDEVVNFNQFKEINQWLARLRLRLGLCNESDLELSLFRHHDRSPMKYEQFARLFKFVYSRDDLKRDPEIEKLFLIDLDLNAQVSRDLFFGWSLKFLSTPVSLDKLDVLFKKIWAEIPVEQVLGVDLWMTYLQALISKTNFKISLGDPQGVQVLNLNSCEHSLAKILFVMGLSEEAFRTQFQTAISAFDVRKLAQDFGFQIFSPDQKRAEFQAKWILGNNSSRANLSYAVTNFSGQILSPSWLWLEGAQGSGHALKTQVPDPTRWDELQNLAAEQILELKSYSDHDRRNFLKVLNHENPNLKFKQSIYLSASSLESYAKCPFIYKATRLFKLTDQPSLDLDIDHMTKGSLIHKIFEKLTRTQPLKFTYQDQELGQIVDEAKDENAMILGDERLWHSQKRRYIKIAKRFLEFEKAWRAEFPKTQSIGQEVKVQASLDPETLEFKAFQSQQDPKIIFRGSIDRIDVDGDGHAVIIDYKSSGGGLSQYTSWLKNDQLQLLLYALAVENGWTAIPAQQVVSAVYLVVQNMSRDLGFKLISDENWLYSLADKKKNKIHEEERTRLLTAAYSQAQKKVSEILKGDFRPEPKKPEDCPECKWRELCRAEHLSQ